MPHTQPFHPEPPRRPGLFARIRSNFLTGLVVIAPIGLTIWLIWSVVGWIDGFVLPLVPNAWQPDKLIQTYLGLEVDRQINVRGIGVIIFLLFTVVVGWMAKGLIGRSLLRWAESLVERTPVVRSIYGGVKQIAETIFAQTDTNFDKACLIEYPRKGIWAIGFISTATKGEVLAKAGADQMTSVFVPTTPNPTSGFLLFFPTDDIIELDMSVEDAAKLVISAGLVYPNAKDPSVPSDASD
ncbi:DUF502 domain-containing protein [Nereida sp. MMG025]|uniref:DUF502 domain-containing protein n=1 Tax=Nereida sp. MMG025 TaxID=2909981 RepID=UPI001F3E0518|nr:DUF502 domain-containing protein [Nereida sp. MMG025]MCF6443294.1 DUF502 domain-containing protein [Nereida sp. MMG025]